ncbi:gas vesicle protein GvpO [Alteribacillus bidgolensis]|uniref:Gas vesicle synthesis protein GvpO n=1 Tax=Alteribacillus bidgolensis TaxID=930129 RepID=A0A1G8IJ32_9BACI|nr:gas vesicle protein GvpO [Alteribacillus bidgolensis]SDI18915.1 Gas vesicle synthesis protein GvpO [Alteribacillus bidgolensis]
MKMEEIISTVNEFFSKHVQPPFRITSVVKQENGWDVELEVIEEKEYMKAYAKDQLLGVYEAKLDQDMEVISFERVSLRPRSAPLDKNEGG